MSKETFLFAVIVPKCLVMSTMRTANSVSTCSFLSVLCFILRRCSRMLHDSQKRTPALACAVSYLCRTFYFNRLNRVCKAKAAVFWHGFQKICLFQNRDADCICIELHAKTKRGCRTKARHPAEFTENVQSHSPQIFNWTECNPNDYLSSSMQTSAPSPRRGPSL